MRTQTGPAGPNGTQGPAEALSEAGGASGETDKLLLSSAEQR